MLERPPQNGKEKRGGKSEGLPAGILAGAATEEQPTAMGIAFEEAKAAKQEEIALGTAIGEELWKTLSDPGSVKKLSEDTGGEASFERPVPKPIAPQEKSAKTKELSEIYGDKTPPVEVVEMLKKLKSKEKRAGYLALLREAEEKKHTAGEAKKPRRRRGRRTGKTSPRPASSSAPEGPSSEPVSQAEEDIPAVFHSNRPSSTWGEAEDGEMSAVFRDVRRTESKDPTIGAPIVPNPDEAIDQEHVKGLLGEDRTPKEWRDELRGLVEKTLTANPSEAQRGRLEKMQKYLEAGSKELGSKAEKITGLEGKFRSWGESYNKIPMVQKVALGSLLAVGYGVTLPISGWLAAAYAAPLFITRVAAMAGSFGHNREMLNRISKGEARGWLEKTRLYMWLGSGSEKGRENKAMVKALIQSFGMTAGLATVAHEIAEYNVAERIGQWMVEHMSGGAPMHGPEAVGVISHPHAAATAASEAAAAHATEMPTVGASSHGYEGMLKEMWQRVHAPGFHAPANLDPQSDLAQLLKADGASLDKIVHELAGSRDVGGIHGHHFFNPDGTSVRIDANAHMTIGPHGEIHLEQGGHDFIEAPSGAPVTHAPHLEGPHAPLASHPEAPASVSAAHPSAPEAAHRVNPVTGLVNEQPPAPVETAIPQPVTQVHDTLVDSSGTPVVDSQGMPVHTGSYEPSAHAAPAAEHGASVPADHAATSAAEHPGVFVDPSTTHVYAEGGRLYVFGGNSDALDAQAQAYALTHHVSVFVDKSYKLLGFINTPRVVEYAPQPDGSVAMVIHPGPSLVPDPQKFTKRVF